MKAAIFDMDGLLMDSEPLWQEAEISVFRAVGVPLTRELCRQTVGIRLDGVVRHWYEKFPWQRSMSLRLPLHPRSRFRLSFPAGRRPYLWQPGTES